MSEAASGAKPPLPERHSPRWQAARTRARDLARLALVGFLALLVVSKLAATALPLVAALRHTLVLPMAVAGVLLYAVGHGELLLRAVARAALAIVLAGLLNAALIANVAQASPISLLWLASMVAGTLALVAADVALTAGGERHRIGHLAEGLLAVLWFVALSGLFHTIATGGSDEPVDLGLPFFAAAAAAIVLGLMEPAVRYVVTGRQPQGKLRGNAKAGKRRRADRDKTRCKE